MANLHFKRFGVIILESDEGDVLLSDPSLASFADENFKHETIVMRELIDKIESGDQNAEHVLARQFVNFLNRNQKIRWERARENLAKVALKDPSLAHHLTSKFDDGSISGLRKIEKDVHFWRMQNDDDYTAERPGKFTTK